MALKITYPPCGRLYGELVGKYRGPILVIGGGPSAPKDLEELKASGLAPIAVLSANEHGHQQRHFQVTHTVSADGSHHAKRIRMDVLLKPFNTPLISPVFFADYRLPDWRLACNTGLIAIAIALGMGGSPVVVVGLDFFKWKNPAAGTYFHDAAAESSSNVKKPINFENQITALHGRVGYGQPIRPLSGPLLEHYRRWTPEELTPAPVAYEYARFCRRMETHIMRAHASLHWPLDGMRVDRGREIPCSPLEARAAQAARQALLLRVIPSPLERDQAARSLQSATNGA